MRFLFRWVFRLFLITVVLVVAAVLLKDAAIKALAEQQIRARTGLDVSIGRLEVSLLSPTLRVRDLKIYNRPEFGGSPMLTAPDLHIECARAGLFSQKFRFTFVRFDISEMHVVESADGRTNLVDVLGAVQWSGGDSADGKGTSGTFGGIDTLNFSLGNVRYYSMKDPSRVTDIRLGVRHEIVKNVRTFEEFSALILRAMLRKGITITDGAGRFPSVTPAAMERDGTYLRGAGRAP